MSYINIRVKHWLDLDGEVSKMMDKGYWPLGSPYIGPDQCLTQAMTRIVVEESTIMDDIKPTRSKKNGSSKKVS